MTGTISTRRNGVFVKRAGTYLAVPPSMTGAGVSFIEDFSYDPQPMRIDKKNMAKRSFGPAVAQWDEGGSHAALQLKTPLFRPLTPGSLPTVSELLWACGLKETVAVGTSVKYEPQTPSDVLLAQSAYAEIYQAGKKYTMNGMRGDFTLTGKPKDGLVFDFKMLSPLGSETVDTDSPTLIHHPALKQLAFVAGTAILESGYAIDVGAFEFSLKNSNEISASSMGVRSLIDDFLPTLKINPLSVATRNDLDRLMTSTQIHFSITVGSGIFVLEIPRAVIVEQKKEKDKAIYRDALVFECTESVAGDDAFSMTFA